GSHAERAVRGALFVVLAAQRLKSWTGKRFPGRGPELAIGIGVDTGSFENYLPAGASESIRGQAVDVAVSLGKAVPALGWSVAISRDAAAHADFALLAGRNATVPVAKSEDKIA